MKPLIGKPIAAVIIIGGLLPWLASCGKSELTAFSDSERGPAEISAQVDKAAGNPGDVITFTLSADYRDDVTLEIPEIADKFSEFRIVNSGGSPPVRRGERLFTERWYKLQADLAGSYVIAPVEVKYALPGGKEEIAKTPKIFLEIRSLLAKEDGAKDIRDIKPPLPLGPSYRVPAMAAAALVLAALLLLLAFKLIRRLKSKPRAVSTAPRPAHEEALEALQRLLKKRLVERGQFREFCFEISEIFRRYMQARFGIPAIDLTTDEILPRVEENGVIIAGLKPVVREFLTGTDIVKFAKHRPSRDEIDRIIENTVTFISKTKMTATAENEDSARMVSFGEHV